MPPPIDDHSARVLDCPVHALDYTGTVRLVASWISSRTPKPRFIIQTNAHSLVVAQEDSAYREALAHATLSVPDGMPLVWLLRAKGYRVKNRVYGPDLMLLLCEEAARRGWRCFLYGGAPGVAEQLKEILERRFPGLKIVGTYSPPFRPLSAEEDAEVCRMINAAKPDILWVGLGAPKQDLWMYEHRDRLDVAVMHGVGAAFDFLTGRVKQAPRWMMNAGLEWLFRLLQEPRRLWRRYTITNLKFVFYVVLHTLKSAFRRSEISGHA